MNIVVLVKQPIVLPTLPSLPALDGSQADRLALLAGLMFVEGATNGWGARDLTNWFITYGSVMGRKAPPQSVTDAVVGSIALVPGAVVPAPPSSRSGPASARQPSDKMVGIDALPKLLAMSRWRVVVTLRGLLSQPADDRFLQAAIFAGRVRREKSTWVAQASETDLLSDIVLSLFAADILMQRSFHEQNMCVCDVCGRISYNPATTSRSGCSDHPPKTDSMSGFQLKDRRPSPPPDDPASGPVSGRKPRS